MEHFSFRIAEMDVTQFDVTAVQRLCQFLRPHHFLRVNDIAHFCHNGIHLRDIIGIGHDTDQRFDQADREDDDRDEIRRADCAVHCHDAADRQDREHGCRHDAHCKGHIDIAFPHPVYEACSALFRCSCKFFIAGLCLAEYLDDLDAVDVFGRDGVERFCRTDGSCIVLLVAEHHQRIADCADRDRDQRRKTELPADEEGAEQNDDRRTDARCEFRQNMCKRSLNAVDTFNDRAFERTGRLTDDIAERHFRQLIERLFADDCKRMEGREMRIRCGKCVEE